MRQSDMNDQQMLTLAQNLQTGYSRLEKVVLEGQNEIEDERLIEVVRQYQSVDNCKILTSKYVQLFH